MKSLFSLCAINNNFSVLNENKDLLLGLRVKCNLLGMLGEGNRGNEGIYISEHYLILGRQKPKQRLKNRAAIRS